LHHVSSKTQTKITCRTIPRLLEVGRIVSYRTRHASTDADRCRLDSPRGGDIAFLTDDFCCLTGTIGVLRYSSDRGMRWKSDTTEYRVYFRKLYPIRDEGYIFAWGYDQLYNRELLRGDFRSLTMVEEAIVPVRNSVITINTYPNPFYDDVAIGVHGPSGAGVRISVRDLLGREVFHEYASIPYTGVYTMRWRPAGNHLSCASYLVFVSSQRTMASSILHHLKYAH